MKHKLIIVLGTISLFFKKQHQVLIELFLKLHTSEAKNNVVEI